MNDQIIKDRFTLLSSGYQEFLKSDYVRQTAQIFGQSLSFDEDQTIVLENALSMYLLIFLDRKGLIDFISTECKLKRTSAVELVDTILSGLPSQFVIEHAKQFQIFESDEVTNSAETPAAVTPTAATSPKPQAVPASTPAPQSPPPQQPSTPESEPIVQPLRTMEHDMDKIHGYGAYRKMYPDAEVESAIPDPASVAPAATPAPENATQATAPVEEPVVQAVPQNDVLEKTPPAVSANVPEEKGNGG